jgi:hypothetical protein
MAPSFIFVIRGIRMAVDYEIHEKFFSSILLYRNYHLQSNYDQMFLGPLCISCTLDYSRGLTVISFTKKQKILVIMDYATDHLHFYPFLFIWNDYNYLDSVHNKKYSQR